MVLSDERDDHLFKRHSDLCNKLNLDPKTVSDSWDNFQSIHKSYGLEGDPLHWLGCSVFVACQGTETPTLGQTVLRGNCVSLTSLLRHSKLSFAEFFAKINRWSDMANMHDEFKRKIKQLSEVFGVTCNTFHEFYPLFEKVFMVPDPQDLDQSKQHRNRKQRPVMCNNSKVFEFVWILFVTLKGEDPLYSSDLVKSYHLLYACLDLAFKNAFLAKRTDLLNPNFDKLPRDWTNPAFEVPLEAPCLINNFCKSPPMLTDAIHMKVYVCKNLIVNLIKNGVLSGNVENLTGILDAAVFETNFKNITKTYEAQLLNKGDFDERIFMAEYRRILLEREQAQQWNVRASPFREPRDGSLDSPRNSGAVAPRTPLTGRAYLAGRDADSSPYSADIERRLHNMVHNRAAEASPGLLQLFQSCSNDPTEKIKEIVARLGQRFTEAYPINNVPDEEESNTRLRLAVTLFFKFIENILQNERVIRHDISALVQKDLFYECMFACCLEIVIFSYNSPREFPWILQTLQIEPYHFVKVIELIIRSKEHLCKEMIKHLNRIEETIIESLAWKSESQLWEVIKNSGQEIPKFEDTALSGHLLYNNDSYGNNGNSRVQNTEVTSSVLESPGPSATDRFQSPITHGVVNRQLFPTVRAGQSVLQKHLMVTGSDGNKKLIPIVDAEGKTTPETALQNMPKRTGSLSIIFRKFYNLAGVRMENLCTKLNIKDVELKRKIWTVFEDSIRHTDLMKDRHLDQLLMCAVYVICKICKITLKFQDIMKFYREQPQAGSNIYRNVLLKKKNDEPRDEETSEERGDLISFYNSIYVEVMKTYALKIQASTKHQNSDIFLSPLPAGKRNLISPSVQVGGNVFVKPLESPKTASLAQSFNYIFSRSPSKDLKDINKAINNNGVTGKRLLADGDMDIPNNKRISNRKIQALVEERRSQNTE